MIRWWKARKVWRPVQVMHGEFRFGGGLGTVVLYRNDINGKIKTETHNGLWDPKHFGIEEES